MSADEIQITGAKEHNLKNVDVSFPINKISCVGGRSGSGKSSLIFTTLYNESKRIFLNSLPTSAQLFAHPPSPAQVDNIHPVLPVIGLKQKNPIKGKKLNVSDLTGAGDLLESIFEKSSVEVCPEHSLPLIRMPLVEIFKNSLIKLGHVNKVINLMAKKEDYTFKFGESFFPARSAQDLESEIGEFSPPDDYYELTKIKVKSDGKIQGSIDDDLLSVSKEIILFIDGVFHSKVFLGHGGYRCPKCDYNSENKFSKHRFFSSFSPLGACGACRRFGSTLEYTIDKLVPNKNKSPSEGGVKFLTYKRMLRYEEPFLKELKKQGFDPKKNNYYTNKKFITLLEKGSGKYPGVNSLVKRLEKKIYKMNVRVFLSLFREEVACQKCNSTRISPKRFNFLVDDFSLKDLLELNFYRLKDVLEKRKNEENWKNLYTTSYVACDLGLGHLNLTRKALSLNSSEHQRCLLLNNLNFKGSGCLFVFDEPSLGLGIDEQKKFFRYLKDLKSNQNTIIIIDHSPVLKKLSDLYVEIGPGAGPDGGNVTYSGKYKERSEKIKFISSLDSKKSKKITLKNISIFDLSLNEATLFQNSLNLIHGPNGSGKTAFFVHGLANYMNEKLGEERFSSFKGKIGSAKGLENIEDVLLFSPEFTKPSNRSTIATYLGFSTIVRKYFSNLPMSKAAAYKEGHFSSNSALGQCSGCQGQGFTEIDMHFLESIKVSCEDCNGQKFKQSILSVNDGLYDIFTAGNTSIKKLFERIPLTPKYKRIFQMLCDLSLDYLTLDRGLGSLSGGEFQRLRLIKYLESNISNNLIILENISFGLSSYEVASVLSMLEQLAATNTIIIIDHSTFLKKHVKNQIFIPLK